MSSAPGLDLMPSNSSANDFCRMTSGRRLRREETALHSIESIIVVLGGERDASHHGQVGFVVEAHFCNEPNIRIGLDNAGELLDLPSRRFVQRRALGRWWAVVSLFAEVAEVPPGRGHDSVKQAGLLQSA